MEPEGDSAAGKNTDSLPIELIETPCAKDKDDDTEICAELGDSCTNACNTMYSNSEELSKCKKLTSQQVSTITNIHILLTGGAKANFQNFSDNENDKLRGLACYSSIGQTNWLNWVKTDAGTKQAQDTLEWMAENKKITSILTNNSNTGTEIIKNLLLKTLPNNITLPDKAISTATIGTYTGRIDTTDLWRLNYSTLEIFTVSPAVPEKITFSSNEDIDLYVSLSHFTFNKNADNILSYSISENNSNFFAVIFDILNEVCNSVGNNNNETIACTKTLLCWTNQRSENIWNIIKNNNKHKEVLGGEENYDNCTAGGFAELF